jgi:hypothetical protein
MIVLGYLFVYSPLSLSAGAQVVIIREAKPCLVYNYCKPRDLIPSTLDMFDYTRDARLMPPNVLCIRPIANDLKFSSQSHDDPLHLDWLDLAPSHLRSHLSSMSPAQQV